MEVERRQVLVEQGKALKQRLADMEVRLQEVENLLQVSREVRILAWAEHQQVVVTCFDWLRFGSWRISCQGTYAHAVSMLMVASWQTLPVTCLMQQL